MTAAVVGVIASLALTVAANVLFGDVETARPFFDVDSPAGLVVDRRRQRRPRRRHSSRSARFRVNVAWVALGGGLAGLVLEVVR